MRFLAILFRVAVGDDNYERNRLFRCIKTEVFTAYEYLKPVFDIRVRSLAAFFFLLTRIKRGITIYAPSLILSQQFWIGTSHSPQSLIGTLVMIYVTSGGTKTVSLTKISTHHCYGRDDFGRMDHFTQKFLPMSASVIHLILLANLANSISSIWISTCRIDIISGPGLLGGLFCSCRIFGADDRPQVGQYQAQRIFQRVAWVWSSMDCWKNRCSLSFST